MAHLSGHEPLSQNHDRWGRRFPWRVIGKGMGGVLRGGLAALFILHALAAQASIGGGQVLDAATAHPIAGAVVEGDGHAVRTDPEGMFTLPFPASRLNVRTPGYARVAMADGAADPIKTEIRLQAFVPKGLYLSVLGFRDPGLRRAALQLIDETELNALVIDVKGDRGRMLYASALPRASHEGMQKAFSRQEMAALLEDLRKRGIYTIARVVAFKDAPFALAHPELAVHNGRGGVWTDGEGQSWADPFRPEVHDHVIAVAEEAAGLGFDEIQFDYMRFPDATGLVFSKPSTEAGRVAAITSFLTEAKRRLTPYNVFVAADIFGYVLWNQNDTGIGQRLADLAPLLDYLSPMLYPSGFQYGIPGYRESMLHPYEIVNLSLRNAQMRTRLPAVRFRPWLQAFRDYAFDRRPFTADEIRAQIRAAEAFGSNGWMLWNPRNVYSDTGLRRDGRP